jgi:hypothetical protein
MRRRSVRLGAILLLVATMAAACGSPDEGADDRLRAAIRSTERQPREFVYEEEVANRRYAVKGVVEDDFRYSAKVTLNDAGLYEEVVSDDTVAARFVDPASIGFLAIGAPGGAAAGAVAAKQWVVDEAGAPVLLASATVERQIGQDPIVDALTSFRYVEQVLRQQRVVEFDENSLEYRPQEDPFPKPKDNSSVVRFDFFPPKLPKATDSAGANQAVPGPQHFRKMVVYVQDGRIIRILEQFDVIGKLDELRRNYDLQLDDEVSPERQAAVAIEAINAVRRGQGQDPIRPREMSLTLTKIGDEVAVELPETNAVAGDVSFLRNRGRAARLPTATTTTAPSAAG